MNEKSPTRVALVSLIPPLAVWAIRKVLEMPAVKGSVMELDAKAFKRRHEVERMLRRGARNAKSNRAWIVAGTVAIVVGIGLIARATARGK